MEMGDLCKVILATDETMDISWLGIVGSVVKINYHHTCGEVPNDPMITLRDTKGREEQFWTEELELQ